MKFRLKVNQHKPALTFGKPLIIDRDGIEFNGERLSYEDFRIRMDGVRLVLFFHGSEGVIGSGSPSIDRFIAQAVTRLSNGVPFDDVERAYIQLQSAYRWMMLGITTAVIVGGGLAGLFLHYWPMILGGGMLVGTIWRFKRQVDAALI